MSDPKYILIGTFPGSHELRVITADNKRHVAATEENKHLLEVIARNLLDENLLSSAQVYMEAGPVMFQEKTK